MEEDGAPAELSGGWQESPVPHGHSFPAAGGQGLLRILPPELCEEFGVVPLRLHGGCVEVAAQGELGPKKKRAFMERAGVPVRFVTVPAATMERLARKRGAPARQGLSWLEVPESAGQWPLSLADEPQE